jgi:hypothetical protein
VVKEKPEQKSLYIPAEIIQAITLMSLEEKRSFNFIAIRLMRKTLIQENKLPNEQKA